MKESHMRYFRQLFLMIMTGLSPLMGSMIDPLPLEMEVDEPKAALGKKLFFDPILSKDNTISCATCHNLENGGDDNLKFSFGIKGQEGIINSPTVYNAVFNFRQFWDGRAKDLAEQALGPIENPVEMGNTFPNLIKTLYGTPYKKAFEAIYPDGITKANIVNAIAEFEKALITPNAPFDRYLRGDQKAITDDAKAGFSLFQKKGCISCHHGINVGGNLYNKFGIMEDAKSADFGRYNVTKRERDKFYFKVPSLRNIARTTPYFHDGRTGDLTEAVKIMAMYQLGRSITDEEVEKIVAFLISLTGELPARAKQ